VNIERIIKPMLPFYGVIILMLIVVAFIPELTLTLPRLLGLMP
jgi:TRAP-type C4-dicarboxylate transport system permease large subunit